MISILILTFNEEQNLPACLDSVNWCDDILVLDSFSSDRSMAIARGRGARTMQNRFVSFAEQRNFGIAHGNFKHDWILHLDADERVTPELHAEMLEVIRSGSKGAYQLPSRMMFNGRWLKHSGLFPWHQVRLGKKEVLTFTQVGHGQRETLSPEQIGTLTSPLTHYSFSKGISNWIERHNRYSSAEAQQCDVREGESKMDWGGLVSLTNSTRRRRALKCFFARLPCRPFLRFFYMYFVRRGFLDGGPGLTYCCLLSVYEYFIVLKERELRRSV